MGEQMRSLWKVRIDQQLLQFRRIGSTARQHEFSAGAAQLGYFSFEQLRSTVGTSAPRGELRAFNPWTARGPSRVAPESFGTYLSIRVLW
jgi:hypothetical protein